MLQVLSWWAISDVFEEGGFNSNEFANIYGNADNSKECD